MKVLITSKGNSLNSLLDHRFGRCAYFVIYDTGNSAVEFIPNPNTEREEMAGPASVQLAASKNVNKIVSGEFGIKIKTQLDSMRIQMIILKNHKIKIHEIIDLLNRKK